MEIPALLKSLFLQALYYQEMELTSYEIIEKQVKALRQTISNDEKYIGFKIDW